MVIQLLLAVVVASAGAKPAAEGIEGQRAFDDLAACYSGGRELDLSDAWKCLQSVDRAKRERAGSYLLAVCKQSFADENTGRSSWSYGGFPGFGERPTSQARATRKQLANALADRGCITECLPVIDWLLRNDVLADTQMGAIRALSRIRGPEADEMLLSLLSPPHPNGRVLATTLKEIARRNIAAAAEPVVQLAVDYRSYVRQAARELASKIGLENLPTYELEQALARSFDADLKQIEAMVMVPVPSDSPFVRIVIRRPDRQRPQDDDSDAFGWVLSQSGGDYRILDEYANESTIPKVQATIEEYSLAKRVRDLVQIRERDSHAESSGDRESMNLSGYGSFSAQFEPDALRLPEALIGVWAYRRGDLDSAATLLIPRFEELPDRRWPREIVRDLLGNSYHTEMLIRFADYWDYPGTLRLANHLSSAVFDGYGYQYRAKRLVADLPARAEIDFRTLRLPTPAEWHRERRRLSRLEQIDYLVDRLRLISCRQMGWPSDVNLLDEQRSVPCRSGLWEVDRGRGKEVINPYFELQSMEVTPSEAVSLIPRLADEDYLLTYHFWRPWHPDWDTFSVNELIESLINDAAGPVIADLREFHSISPQERPEYLAGVNQRIASQGKSRIVRAAFGLRAMMRSPADPILGMLSILVACVWLGWRRSRSEVAVIGGAFFLAFGVIALWYPALQHERAWLFVDAIPALGGALVAGILLRRSGQTAKHAGLLAVATLAVAWLVDRYLYLGRYVTPYWLLTAGFLLWPIGSMIRQSRKGWGWLTLAALFAILATAERLLPEVIRQIWHFRIPSEWYPVQYHAAWTLLVLLAWASFMRWMRRRLTVDEAARAEPGVS